MNPATIGSRIGLSFYSINCIQQSSLVSNAIRRARTLSLKERSSELLHIDSFQVILDSNSILELLKEPYLQTILPIHFNEKMKEN